ncbi:hypothetical protein SAMN05216489_08525 [Streptomyces sp. 3213]|nr:hypothetical protein SAMN05216489_08525 [Streptomyces sp. 3213] [Streptomyces sp. 3213.3]
MIPARLPVGRQIKQCPWKNGNGSASGAIVRLAVVSVPEPAAVRPYFELPDGLLVMLIGPHRRPDSDRDGRRDPTRTPGLTACVRAGADHIVSGRAPLSVGAPASYPDVRPVDVPSHADTIQCGAGHTYG